MEPFDYTPGDNLEIFYYFHEQPQSKDMVLNRYDFISALEYRAVLRFFFFFFLFNILILPSYAEALRDCGNFKEFD